MVRNNNVEEDEKTPRRTQDASEQPVLVPARGKKVIEIETAVHKEHRRQLRLRNDRRQLQSTSQVSPARGSGTYKITYRFLNSINSDQQSSFTYAANRIGRMLTTSLGQVSVASNVRCDLAPGEVLPSTLEDMFIFVKIVPLDGVGKVLGQASPCLEDNRGFPRVGYIEFDTFDVAQMISDKTFDAVVVHE